MAQHIPIGEFSEKGIRKIEEVIRNDFRRSYGMKTSMKYMYDERVSKHARLHEDDEVYTIEKNVGQRLVCGGRAIFEIHQNRLTKVVEQIYLVA